MPLSLILGRAEWSLWVTMVVAQIVLFARLAQSGLWRRYRFFTTYVGVLIVESATMLAIPQRTDLYAWTYIGFETAVGFCAVLAVLEVCHLAFEGFSGIATFGRRAIIWSSALALLIAALSLLPDTGNQSAKSFLDLFHVFQRALYSALLLFVLFITGLLVWFPVPLSRNAALHIGVFALSFVSASITNLIRNALGPEVREIVSTTNLGVYTACLLVWILCLTLAGEERQVKVGHRWALEAEDRLLQQLNEINASLLRTARK